MRVEVQVLRTDETVRAEVHDTRKRLIPRQLVDIGTRLHHADPTVAALWSLQRPGWIWTGHATPVQMRALAACETMEVLR